MNLNAARRLRRCVSGFFDCRMADTEGVEPPSSFSCEIEGFRSNMPFDSFPDYRLGNQAQGGELMSSLFCRTLGNRSPIDPS